MRDRALKAVDEKYDGLIAEAQALKTAGGGEAVAKVQADLDQYTTDRVAARQAITDRLATKEVDIALEAAGKGASGKYGDGPAVKVMRKQVEEIRGELAAFDSETQAKLTELRGTRDASIASTASSLETKIDGLRAQQASEQERVRKMSAKELADEYLVQPGESWTKTDKGGTTTSESKYLIQDDWNPARGFLARFRELREIESDAHKAMVQDLKARGEEEKWYDITTESLIIWMVRLAMVALGLFILMLKILSSEETRTYFHFGSQVADGQSPKVNQMASVMGHHDADGRRMMGLTPKNRALHEGLSEARRQVVEVVGKFRNRLISLCRANEAGLYPTRVVLQSQLRDFWEQFVAPKMNDLDRAEEKMRLSGLIVHAWPEDLGNGQDPRQVKEPWLVLTRELIELGWEDPQPKLEAGKHGLVRIQELRRGIEDTMLSMESELIQAIVNRPSMPEMELRRVLEPLRHGMYEAEVVPRVRALEESTKAAEAVGLKVPAWSQRPRDLAMCWRLPDPTTLREYGWMDGTAGLTQLAPEVTQPFGTTSS